MVPVGGPSPPEVHSTLPVILDGRVLGDIAVEQAHDLALKLRTLKVHGKDKVG